MDRAAVTMIETLENTREVDGKAEVSLKERMATFEMAMGWLAKREKFKPKDDNDAAGVDLLRDMLEDPEAVVARMRESPVFIAALKKLGWLPPPVKKPGRPTLEEADYRTDFERETKVRGGIAPPDDDSELQKLLAGEAK